MMFSKKNFITTLVLVFALFFALSIAFKWMFPLYQQYKDKTFHYVPILFSDTTNTNDEYFYYSFVREFIDKQFLSTDPLLHEQSGQIAPHFTFYFSFLFGALGGMFAQKTSHAYYFNNLVFPFIAFLVTFFLALRFVKNKIAAFVITVVTLVTNPSFDRFPNILFTNIPLTITCLLFYDKLQKKQSSFLKDIALVCLVGLSPLTSYSNSLFSYWMLFLTILFCFKEKALRANLFYITFFSLVLSLPGIYVLIKIYPFSHQGSTGQALFENTMLLENNHGGFLVSFVLKYVILFLIPLVVLKVQSKKAFIVLFTSMILSGLLNYMVNGAYVAAEGFIRGGLIVFRTLTLSVFFSDYLSNIFRRLYSV